MARLLRYADGRAATSRTDAPPRRGVVPRTVAANVHGAHPTSPRVRRRTPPTRYLVTSSVRTEVGKDSTRSTHSLSRSRTRNAFHRRTRTHRRADATHQTPTT